MIEVQQRALTNTSECVFSKNYREGGRKLVRTVDLPVHSAESGVQLVEN